MHLEDAIEGAMLAKLSQELERRGITDAGVAVPLSDMRSSGMGSLGTYFPPWWADTIKRKQVAKSEQAAVVTKQLMNKQGDLAKELKAKEAAGQDVTELRREYIRTSNQAIAASGQVDAPAVTKAEVIDSVRPAIRKMAVEAAEGVRANARRAQKHIKVTRPGGPKRETAFFSHRELDWVFPGMGQTLPQPWFPDWFQTYPEQDWDLNYSATEMSPTERGQMLRFRG